MDTELELYPGKSGLNQEKSAFNLGKIRDYPGKLWPYPGMDTDLELYPSKSGLNQENLAFNPG
ncbi:hypothetical protein [Sporolactobacillus nakayamae]|uniref:hypothetical protein n=1 Tax=Sporolactobacillus nakayamae TaxID=269670 RepID=UPI000B8822E8|nr:hypothetical protein [Sporolactobacillus nakayamae]